jgi:gliding motility-associated-like protein
LSRNLYILLLSLVLPLSALRAQYNNIEFVENKGQWDSKIKFAGKVNAGAFYVQQKGFQVLQHNVKDWEQVTDMMHYHGSNPIGDRSFTLHSHSYQVQFINGNEDPEIIPDKPLPGYNNYFLGNDPSRWASECKGYQGITMKNVYPNVDVRYYTDNGGMKYDLIVHPGGDVSRIAMKYVGADKLEIKNKVLSIATSVGELKELNPSTYQYNEKGKREIATKFILRNNVVSFDVKDYDKTQTLVIDPVVVFCSFAGSTSDNWGFTATYGPDGSMYGGGIVFTNGWPVSIGAYQTFYQGGQAGGFGPIDIGIIKLNPTGTTRDYATYLGGPGNEIPQSLICDPQGNLIVAGRTNSAAYPVFPNNNIGVPNSLGGWDIILTKLNATGTALLGSKIIGGSNDDGANISPFPNGANSLQHNYGDESRSEVMLDGSGNIWLASCTQSTNFPTLSAFQTTNGGSSPRNQDAVVLKFSPDLTTYLFGSYLGGNGDDAAYVIDVSPTTGHIYVGGGTTSNNFPGNHTGTVGANYNGSIDGFVAEISGTTLVRSTYLGTSNYDQVYGIKFDKFGFPYVTGQTMSGSWPHVNATYFDPGGKQFIAKLQPDLSSYVYSTTFGPNSQYPNISPTAFLVDRCENVYVSGWGGCFSCGANIQGSSYPNSGTFGMPLTPDAMKNESQADGKDFYFIVIKKNATALLFGSYFGENNTQSGTDHVDGGTSRFDQNGVIYQAICANCKALEPTAIFPTTPNVWSFGNPAQTGAKCNLAMLKINFNLAGVASDVVSSINGVPKDSAGCVPLTVDFYDTALNAVSYEWNFGDGSPQLSTTNSNVSHTYATVGTYIVMLVAIDSSSCNIRDTSYVHIKVGDLQALPDFNFTKLNPCDSFKYQFDNISVAPATAPFSNTTFIWDFGDGSARVRTGTGSVFHSYATAGTYNVRLIIDDTTYCNAPDSITKQVSVAALVKAQFTTPPYGCVPYNAVFTNTSIAGQTFQWNFGDGGTSNAINPTHLYNTPGTYMITLVATDPNTCNVTDSTKLTIVVSDIPTAAFTFSPTTPIENTPNIFSNASSPDAIRFLWKFGDGDSLKTNSRADVSHQYNSTATFTACLVSYNAAGCADTACQQVTTLVVPALDVPNAFTPLSGDINSIIGVKGFGIVKLKFIIWNRWGQKVFETSDRNLGWDGRFKGQLQPMDVYAYTLEAEFFDGKKATKKGDITLIR